MKPESIESRFGTPVRLTHERWLHISAEHAELVNMNQDVLDTVRFADKALAGMAEELLAVRALAGGKTLVVVYREVNRRDGVHHYGVPDAPRGQPVEEKTIMAVPQITEFGPILDAARQSPSGTFWASYDREADVLYINFKKPSTATDSEMTDDDVILRYENKELIGLTILHASTRRHVA